MIDIKNVGDFVDWEAQQLREIAEISDNVLRIIIAHTVFDYEMHRDVFIKTIKEEDNGND